MRAMRSVCASMIAGGLVLGASNASAQENPQAVQQQIDQLRRELETLMRQYGDRLTALEQKLATAEAAPTAPPAAAPTPPEAPPPAPQTAQPSAQVPPGAEGAGGPTGALPVYAGAAAGSKVFNPDMAVIGDFLGAAGRNTINPSPAMEMHESEASFQAIVDPYARADFFISFGESGVDLEEGYLTLTTLPGGLLTKVGKMRAAFGKVNTLHNHVLPWADRPLVTRNLVGGEDGISDAGISVARLIQNPWIFLEATGQVFRGDSGPDENPLFRSSKPGDLSYVAHLRGYHDITEASNIDLGASYARGHNGLRFVEGASKDTDITQLFGVDATFRWRPLQRSIYRSFVGRAEWIGSRIGGGDITLLSEPIGIRAIGPQHANGFYVSGDYQFGRRWFAGARLDRSGRALDASLHDTGGSFIISYWPSEFSQVRGQYRRTNYALGPSADEFLFQFQFSIGAHGAHPF
jgi:hypothetical protein